MISHIKCFILLIVLYNVLASNDSSRDSFKTIEARSVVRKNETPQSPRHYGNIGIKNDSPNDPESTLKKSRSQSVGDYPLFNEYTDHLLNYGISSISSNPLDTEGYPLYVPSWINPDQLMAAIKNMSNATKSLENGLFTKLITNPKIAAAAFVPLSIVAAAIVPVLMNYVLGSTAPLTVSTTANNKGFRSFDASKNLDDIMETIANLTRAMDNN
ncbi:uncharacterized protein TNIN_1701 [Trichonephila inaurata madagascariensis]|uniref:Uncharacterized protein n=1 Tax=Trichonephila inaurata madagascariensis TaxID=2747483 RepID=A0A8X7CU56_9ARAC|nr:uncharacterized protein TNIN_1701 [Trichonephila inaurata madagascariensis]